jgi:predicted glutamine amidotransferase
MCRWLAYSASPVLLSRLLFEPQNSLIVQSLRARHTTFPTNGDGFGIGWYGTRDTPGLFRDVLPAWNDDNLRSLCDQIESRLFLAHVRASTGTATARANCHPFRWKNWLFMHNGRIGGYEEIRREIDLLIDPAFYKHRLGTTDSEAMFYLALTYGLEHDAPRALARMVGAVERVMTERGVEQPLRVSAVVSDSVRLWAVRYSSDVASPTMYIGRSAGALHVAGLEGASDGDILVLSEPLDDVGANWHAVDEGSLVAVEDGMVTAAPFALAA